MIMNIFMSKQRWDKKKNSCKSEVVKEMPSCCPERKILTLFRKLTLSCKLSILFSLPSSSRPPEYEEDDLIPPSSSLSKLSKSADLEDRWSLCTKLLHENLRAQKDFKFTSKFEYIFPVFPICLSNLDSSFHYKHNATIPIWLRISLVQIRNERWNKYAA